MTPIMSLETNSGRSQTVKKEASPSAITKFGIDMVLSNFSSLGLKNATRDKLWFDQPRIVSNSSRPYSEMPIRKRVVPHKFCVAFSPPARPAKHKPEYDRLRFSGR